jgi:hypothetical protein
MPHLLLADALDTGHARDGHELVALLNAERMALALGVHGLDDGRADGARLAQTHAEAAAGAHCDGHVRAGSGGARLRSVRVRVSERADARLGIQRRLLGHAGRWSERGGERTSERGSEALACART